MCKEQKLEITQMPNYRKTDQIMDGTHIHMCVHTHTSPHRDTVSLILCLQGICMYFLYLSLFIYMQRTKDRQEMHQNGFIVGW